MDGLPFGGLDHHDHQANRSQDRTPLLGGGHVTLPVHTLLKTSDLKHENYMSYAENEDDSDGQGVWYVENVLSQLDKWDAEHEVEKRVVPRTFIEFGARNGLLQSNTHWLETYFGFEGLLIDAGEHYIDDLRKNRKCSISGKPHACVWAALDTVIGKTLTWDIYDKVERRSRKLGALEMKKRPVKTITLDHLLKHSPSSMHHIDFFSADCEGCEIKALEGLNDQVKYTVSVYTIEFPDCSIVRSLNEHGYTLFPLPFSYDWVFISKDTIEKMQEAPDLVWHPIRNFVESNFVETKAEKARKCDLNGEELRLWLPGNAWPPAFPSS